MPVVAASSQRQKVLLAVAAAVLLLLRRRLAALLRAALGLPPDEESRRVAMVTNLPGPKFGVGEHPVLGHAAMPPFFRDGEWFTPNLLMERITGVLINQARSTDARLHRLVGGHSMLYKLGVSVPVMIFALDEGVFRTVLASRNQKLFTKGDMYVVSKPLIGNGVLASSHGDWYHQRPIMEMGFKRDVLGGAMPKMLRTAEELCDKISQGAEASADGAWEFQVPELMLKLTMDVIGRVAFDYDFGSVTAERSEDAPLYGPFKIVLKGLAQRGLSPALQAARALPFRFNRNIDGAIARLNQFARTIIRKRVEEHERAATAPDEDRPKDLVDAMVLGIERHKSGQLKRGWLTEQDVVDNIQTGLFAGHDTTAAALTWMTHLLATHPTWQQKIRDEAVARCGADGDPTPEGLEEMVSLNAVLTETLRLYPSAGFTRNTVEDVDFGGGLVVPKGVEITLFPIVLHRNPKYYEDPDQFRPERWLDMLAERETDGAALSLQSRMAKYALKRPYFPFSHGERNCVGKPLALMELRVVMVKMLQRFHIEPAEDKDFLPLPVLDLTLNPKSVKVRATPLRECRDGGAATGDNARIIAQGHVA